MKRLLSLILALVLILTCLAACNTSSGGDSGSNNDSSKESNSTGTSSNGNNQNDPVDYFKCIYTQADYDEYIANLGKLKSAVINDESRDEIKRLYDLTEDQASFLTTQCGIANTVYYAEMTDEANAKYDEMDGYNTNAAAEYFKAYREMYNATSSNKDIVFADWTETEIRSLSNLDIDEYVRTNNAMNDILLEYMELDSDSFGWADKVNELYFDHVKEATAHAKAWGYDNYYDYMTENVYVRDYSAADRDRFRQYVKEYVIPLYAATVNAAYSIKPSATDYNDLTALTMKSHKDLKEDYLNGFINTFSGSIKEKMLSVFQNNRILYGDENSTEAAFTMRLDYYDDSICFFAEGYYQSLPTFVHELGHYVSFFNYSSSGNAYDLLETHSQGTEWLLLYYLDGKLSESLYDLYFISNAADLFQLVITATIIDEFEETVYKAATPYTADEYDDLLKSICNEYNPNVYDSFNMAEYIKHVSIQNPVYYLSYATSAISAVDFYVIANTEGYAAATEIYRRLQEGEDKKGFVYNLEKAGLSNPFKESTYTNLYNNFVNYLK